jgi:hypothetical protein
MNDPATPVLRNHVKDKLAKGETVYSMTVRLVRTVDIASIAHTAGFDSVYIDMEHSSFSLEAAGQICMACNHLGVTPLVRVPGLDPAYIARVMDSRRRIGRPGTRPRSRGQARTPRGTFPRRCRAPTELPHVPARRSRSGA